VSGIVIDTSAAITILLREDGAELALAALDDADPRLISTATMVELGIVLEARLGPIGASVAERFVRDGGIDVVPFDRTHLDRALEGWRHYGRGRHAAGLNMGDCFTYGLAVDAAFPVLCFGTDFARTDLEVLPA
jgi:ribonuclease VapC